MEKNDVLSTCPSLYIYIHNHIYIYIQCEAPKISKLVNITPRSLWFLLLITIVTGAFVNQRSHHWGASHCMKPYETTMFHHHHRSTFRGFPRAQRHFFFLHLDQDLKIAQHFRLVNYYNLPRYIYIYTYTYTGWWFQTFFIFPYIGNGM